MPRRASLFERAIALDPDYALAHAFLALAIFNEDWGERRAERSLRALPASTPSGRSTLDPTRQPLPPHPGAWFCCNAREFERAELHSVRSLALNPNDAHAAAYRAHLLFCTGREEEGLAMIRKAIDLNPYHPWLVLVHPRPGAAGRRPLRRGDRGREQLTELRFHHQARLAACQPSSVRWRPRASACGGLWR